jgi:hypothetical protein
MQTPLKVLSQIGKEEELRFRFAWCRESGAIAVVSARSRQGTAKGARTETPPAGRKYASRKENSLREDRSDEKGKKDHTD